MPLQDSGTGLRNQVTASVQPSDVFWSRDWAHVPRHHAEKFVFADDSMPSGHGKFHSGRITKSFCIGSILCAALYQIRLLMLAETCQ